MVNAQIQEGFEVFVSDADKPFGAVHQASPQGRTELIVYVENAGDFTVALSAERGSSELLVFVLQA